MKRAMSHLGPQRSRVTGRVMLEEPELLPPSCALINTASLFPADGPPYDARTHAS